MTLSHISHTLPYSIERIWDTVTDLERFAWRSDIKEIKILDEHNFIEVTKNGTETHFHTTKLVAYNTWEFDLENGSIEGHWTGSFRQQGHETLVDFTENVVVLVTSISMLERT